MLTHRHIVRQHHTARVQATQTRTPHPTPSTSLQHLCTHPCNQPTNQPASETPPSKNPSTNNQPTNPTTNQATRKPTANQPRSQVHTRGGGGCITWEHWQQGIPLTNTAQLVTLQHYTKQPHTTDTHGREEGRSNTPTSWCHCVPTSSPQSKKPVHLQRGNGYPS